MNNDKKLTSKLYGATFNPRNKNKCWVAVVKFNGTKFEFGSHTSAKAASEAAKKGRDELELCEPAYSERNKVSLREQKRIDSDVHYMKYCQGVICKTKPTDERRTVRVFGHECLTCYETSLLGDSRKFRSFALPNDAISTRLA